MLESQMPIKEDVYFSYALPAIFFLFLGVFIFNRDIRIDNIFNRIEPVQASRLGYLLLCVSYFFDIIQFAGVSTFDSIISFTSYLKYIGVFCFLFTKDKMRYILIGIVYIQLAFIVLRGGVFIHFFIWSTYLFFFFVLIFKFSFWVRATFIFIAAPVLILVQGVKHEYRKATWEGNREAGVELFGELANREQTDEPFAQSSGVIRTVGRLTQGWHLGLTLKRVPQKEPFSNGDELISDITSSLIPRLFLPNKKVVGSQDKFYKFTGHRLWGSTSMTIGVLGDFYINFGRWGSFAGLFIFGAVIARLLFLFMRRYVLSDPINVIWVPFLLSYLIRANNDFYMVFNNMTKGFIIFLFINFLRKKLWPPRITIPAQRAGDSEM
jgi:hypothetical protein